MSPENEVADLREIVTELRISNANLSASVTHLTKSVDELATRVLEMRDTINKGRGALWLLVGASSLAGAGLAKMISRLFGVG